MESLIATDWLKDYDPLFDLIERETGTNGEHSSDFDLNHYDLSGYYNPYKQIDELSIMLGLEWVPCLELNSPSTTSCGSSASAVQSPDNSAAPSPSGPISSGPPSPSTSQRSTSSRRQADDRPKTPSARASSSANGFKLSKSSKASKKCLRTKGTSLLAQPSTKLLNQQQHLPQLSVPIKVAQSCSGNSNLLTFNRPATVSSLVTTIAQPNLTLSSISSSTSNSSNISNNNSNISNSTASHQAACPSASAAIALSQQVLTTISTTALTSNQATNINLIKTSIITNVKNDVSKIISPLKQHHIQTHTYASSSKVQNLTKLDSLARYCAKVEHSYSLSHSIDA